MKKTCKISGHLIRFYTNIPKKLMKHIQSCKECSEKLKTIKLFSKLQEDKPDYATLEKAPNCPDDNLFAAFLDGELRGKEREKVENHLLKCHHCFHIAAEYVKEHQPAQETVEDLLLQEAGAPAMDIKAILEKVKTLSRQFIDQKYPQESTWFEPVWKPIETALSALSSVSLSTMPQPQAIGFTSKSNLTIAKTILILAGVMMKKEKISDLKKLEAAIGKYGKKYKADKTLQKEITFFLKKVNKL